MRHYAVMRIGHGESLHVPGQWRAWFRVGLEVPLWCGQFASCLSSLDQTSLENIYVCHCDLDRANVSRQSRVIIGHLVLLLMGLVLAALTGVYY